MRQSNYLIAGHVSVQVGISLNYNSSCKFLKFPSRRLDVDKDYLVNNQQLELLLLFCVVKYSGLNLMKLNLLVITIRETRTATTLLTDTISCYVILGYLK